MIEAKLRELQNELRHLSSLMRQFKIPNYPPPTKKKNISRIIMEKGLHRNSHVNSTPGRFSQKAQHRHPEFLQGLCLVALDALASETRHFHLAISGMRDYSLLKKHDLSAC